MRKTNEKVYQTREGNFLTKPFRFIKRHALNIVNRNRIHSVEATTKELLARYYAKLTDPNATNLEKYNDVEMQQIVSLLKYIDESAAKNITASKLYTLLSCKENKKHSHKIEGLDIWSKLNIFVDNADSNLNVSKSTYSDTKA